MDEITLTPEDAAELLHVSAERIYRAILDGLIPGIMVGGKWRVFRSDVEEYLRDGFYNVARGD